MFENRPTQIAGLIYLLFVILFIVLISLNTHYWKQLLIILLLSFPFVLINLYDIDCVFNGQCDIWGWFKGIFFIVYLIFAIVITIILLVDFQKSIDSIEHAPSTESRVVVLYDDRNDNRESDKLYTSSSSSNIPSVSNPNRKADPGGNGTFTGSNVKSSINLNEAKEKENDKYIEAVVADSNKRGYSTGYWR
jgi:hypothetical protein